MRFALIYGFLLLCMALAGQDYKYSWVATIGSSTADVCSSIDTDKFGNVYSTGYFRGTVDFDPGPGMFNLTSAGESDVYVLKLDAQGRFVSAFSLGGPGNETGSDIKTDTAGNIFLCGTFSQSADLDPGPATQSLAVTQSLGPESFLCKFSSSGKLLWVRHLAGQSGGNAFMAMGPAGSIFLTSSFRYFMNVGPGSFTVNAIMSTVVDNDLLVCAFGGSGNFMWARHIGGPGQEQARSVSLTAGGELIIAGYFSKGPVDFDPGAGTHTFSATGVRNAFVCRLTGSGNFVWAQQIGASNIEIVGTPDHQDNVLLAGNFTGTVDLDPGPGVYTATPTAAGQWNGYLCRLDPAGNFISARIFGCSGVLYPSTIALKNKTIYLSGSFTGGADFGVTPGVYTISPAGASDMFVCLLDSAGSAISAKSFGGNGSIQANVANNTLRFSQNGGLYLAGSFSGSCDFDPDAPLVPKTAAGSTDLFFLKLAECIDAPAVRGEQILVCEGSGAVLTATAAGAISWYTSPSATLTAGNGSTFVTPALSPGSHTYYAASATCTMQGTRTPVIIKVVSNPTVLLSSSNATACAGNKVTLTAKGAHSYTWSTLQTSPNFSVFVTSTTVFSVTGADTLTGCTKTQTLTQVVSPCTDLGEQHSGICRLYPNPASSAFTAETGENVSLALYNLGGSLLLEQYLPAGTHKIGIAHLAPGIYVVRITGMTYSKVVRLEKM